MKEIIVEVWYLKKALPGDIVDNYRGIWVFIEEFGDRSELLLSCCVPDHELDDLALDFHHKRSELHSDGDLVIAFESILCQSLHYAALAHSWNSHEYFLWEDDIIKKKLGSDSQRKGIIITWVSNNDDLELSIIVEVVVGVDLVDLRI